MTTRVRTGLRIPYEQNTKLIMIARKLGMSKNAVILQAIRDYMKEYDLQKSREGRKN